MERIGVSHDPGDRSPGRCEHRAHPTAHRATGKDNSAGRRPGDRLQHGAMTCEQCFGPVWPPPPGFGVRVVEADHPQPFGRKCVGDPDDHPVVLIGPGAVSEQHRVVARSVFDGRDDLARRPFDGTHLLLLIRDDCHLDGAVIAPLDRVDTVVDHPHTTTQDMVDSQQSRPSGPRTPRPVKALTTATRPIGDRVVEM